MCDNIETEVHRSFKTLESIEEDWNRLSSNSIYLTYGWCRSWWKFYGDKKDLSVLVFREDNRIVGVLPLYIDTVRAGLCTLRVVRFVNSIYTACVLHPPIQSDYAHRIFSAALKYMFEDEDADVFSCGQLAFTFASLHDLKRCTKESEIPLRIANETEMGYHAIFHLPSDLDAYLQDLTSDRRQNLRRKIRQIEGSVGPVRVEGMTTLDKILNEKAFFQSLYGQSTEFLAQSGNFLETPHSKEFNLDLIHEFCRDTDWKPVLLKIVAGDQVIGYQFYFTSGTRMHWRITVRRVGEEWGKRGIGIIAVHSLIDWAIRNGIREIEAGPGHYYYKVSMGAHEIPMRSLLIARDSAITRIKVHGFQKFYLLLDLVYYRIWYRRLAKRWFPDKARIPQYYLRCRV